MIEARIVERDENGKEITVLFPESHDLNGPGDERYYTNAARYLIDENLQEQFKTILKSSFGLLMFDGLSIKNSRNLLEALAHSDELKMQLNHAKYILLNLLTLADLSLLYFPKKEMYWRIKIL